MDSYELITFYAKRMSSLDLHPLFDLKRLVLFLYKYTDLPLCLHIKGPQRIMNSGQNNSLSYHLLLMYRKRSLYLKYGFGTTWVVSNDDRILILG